MKRRRVQIAVLVLAVALVFLVRPAVYHIRAAAILYKISGKKATFLPRFLGNYALDETLLTFQSGTKTVRARLMVPRGVSDPSGLVVVHGVHRLGLDEPRLMLFARSIAETGIAVMTPEITELADYDVQPRSVETIGDSTRFLSERLGRKQPVGLMGLCFAGGLSLVAASDARFKPYVGYVFSVGAHNDLARVTRFFATGEAPRPDGTTEKVAVHPYGALVIVYSHAERFFPPAEVQAARDALRLWLWEQFDESKKRAETLSPDSLAKVRSLCEHHGELMSGDVLRELNKPDFDFRLVSPAGRLKDVDAPVFLLHGEGDDVVPATETLWNARELSSKHDNEVLVSRALGHVEPTGKPTWLDRMRIIHFTAEVLNEANR